MQPPTGRLVARRFSEEITEDDHVHIYARDRGDFMCDRAGPWPQPTPDHPMAMAAEVSRPPKSDQRDWAKHSSLNYLKTMAKSIPRAAWNGLTHGQVSDMSDDVFNDLLTTTVYSQYLRGADPEQLDPHFHQALDHVGGAAEYYTVDFTPMQEIEPYKGMWVSPTITLFARDKEAGPCRALAIRIGNLVEKGRHRQWEHIVVTPDDVEAWTLAKYFVLQGAGHVTALSSHPAMHFPFDVVNAITKSALPMDNTLFKLLSPHLRLALAVNHGVLKGGNSVVSQTRGKMFAPYCAPYASVRVLAASGFIGYPHELSVYAPSPTPGKTFPKWEYPLNPRMIDIPSDFGRVLRAYHTTIKDYVREVVAEIVARGTTAKGREEVYFIKRWARYIAHWLPGFPDYYRIMEPDENGDPYLVSAVTGYIWNVSVAHSLDHRSFYRLQPTRTPFRLRVPPPANRRMVKVKRRSILSGWDLFRATLAFDMFFQPHNVSLLKDADYGFESVPLQAAAAKFHKALVETEEQLKGDGVDIDKYISLSEIAASIQH
jgi:hypothetical protein